MNKIYHISGMNCVSCETFLEKEIKDVMKVNKCRASCKKGLLEIEANKINNNQVEAIIKNCGYEIIDGNNKNTGGGRVITAQDIWQIICIVLGLLILLLFLSRLEIIRIFPDIGKDIGLFVAFLLGIMASVSTCLALTGGLVMGFSSQYKIIKDSQHPFWHRALPQFYFHAGRIGGFFLLGGLLGALGSKLVYSFSFTGYLTIFVAIVMFYIGFHILGIVPSITRLGFHLPKKLSSNIHRLQKHEHPLIPAAIGLLTFFLPCGFTQSMQLAAVASGSFINGALIMAFFALGTMPVLFSVGFGSSYAQARNFNFLKNLTGVIILYFALYSLNSGLVLTGSGFSLNLSTPQSAQTSIINQLESSPGKITTAPPTAQTVKMNVNYSFQPTEFRIKKDIPVRFEINAIRTTGCTDEVIIPRLGLTTGKLKPGLNVLEFTAKEIGVLPFSCWMGMQGGRFIVE